MKTILSKEQIISQGNRVNFLSTFNIYLDNVRILADVELVELDFQVQKQRFINLQTTGQIML